MKPSKRPKHKLAGCHGKIAYPSKAKCDIVITTIKHGSGTYGCEALRPYRCPNCQEWHLGNADQKKLPNKKKALAQVPPPIEYEEDDEEEIS